MSTKPKTRIKSPALAVAIPQSKDDCAFAIKTLGDLQRQKTRLETEMNDAIAQVTQTYQPQLEQYKLKIEAEQTGIQAFCEASRMELTDSGKTKTAQFITGSVQWRQRPPSVCIRGADSVIETLKNLGLGRFVRIKEEPNKEAMLNEPDAVKGLAGINVITGVEDFVITPFEQEAA